MLSSKAGIKLFCGGVPYPFQENDLKDLFSAHGTVVSAKIVVDHVGASRGYGFVEMATVEEAALAIQKLNGKRVAGKFLTVVTARRQSRWEGRNG